MIHTATSQHAGRGLGRKAAARVLAAWAVLPLFFLAAGGRLDWWEAWVCCALLLVPMTLFVTWTALRDPEFLARRLQVKEKERIQRRVQAWGIPFYLASLVIPGLDHRAGWSAPPLAAVVAAMAVVLWSYLLVVRVFLENRWAGRTVETWQGQEVISTGPYSVVRHPMYTGFVALQLALPVALGSWWGLVPALAILPIIVVRIRHEEEVLGRELPGYAAYRRKVRYRLIPLVW